MNEQPLREIVDVYLVKCDKGVIALCDEPQSKIYAKKAKESNMLVTTTKITTNTQRARQIGENIFKVSYPFKTKTELINFRNKVLSEWFARCDSIKNCDKMVVWQKVSSKYSISAADPDQFSQSIMDKLEYVCQ